LTYSIKLTPRVEPVQARAQQRVEDILDAAQALLEKNAKVTTSTIAVQAQIPVGSIYRYFPNVHSVYRSLFERLSVELRQQIAVVITKTDSDESWDVLLQEILNNSIVFFQNNPAYGVLLFGIATDGLDIVKRETVSLLSEQLAQRWRAGHDGFHDGDVDDVSRMASRLFTFVEQCYFEQNSDDQDVVSVVEAVKALQAYLSIYLTATS
jgi:AcrR family transcriptional regulator